ncbi:unnamed protein product [Trichobilharzia regenti]|nr:unnamed protein product [Trichobilharzia regenti]
MLDGEIQIGLTIARYIEENLNIDETSSSSSYDWPEDNILQDLRKRRADCIEKMKLIMKQIHEREEELINNHSVYPE